MPPRKRKVAEPDVIQHLNDIVELRVLQVIQDGGAKRSTVYLIECQRRLLKESPTEIASQPSTCVLKTFPPNVFHEGLFQREVAAYTELQRSTAANDPEEAWAVLSSYHAEPASWPFCFGRLQIPGSEEPLQVGGGWIRPSQPVPRPSGAKQRRGLLLEHIPDLTSLTVDRLDDELVAMVRRVTSELHACNVVHGDLVDHASWPHIGFGNIFLRKREGSGVEEVFLMDFNRSRIVGPHPRDQAMAREEEEQMADLLGRALEKKMAIDEVPKEVRKLLGLKN
ncbi:hypothetical protein Daus18300_012432 [Diaporthe australafricana]|uniref:Protein kinase domain-containing protein n=1 Tax=Diaporthe australafricana TaxID=127596 RepID=A0ABR3W2R9_9PEZI